jgi:hypothetical protein
MHKPLFIALNLLLLSLAQPALAAAITNLTEQPQTFEVETANGFVPFTIPAYGTWRMTGSAVIRYHDYEQRLNIEDEYALWPGGSLGPQRRISHGNASFL